MKGDDNIKTERIDIRITKDKKEVLQKIADEKGLNITSLVTMILTEYLNKERIIKK